MSLSPSGTSNLSHENNALLEPPPVRYPKALVLEHFFSQPLLVQNLGVFSFSQSRQSKARATPCRCQPHRGSCRRSTLASYTSIETHSLPIVPLRSRGRACPCLPTESTNLASHTKSSSLAARPKPLTYGVCAKQVCKFVHEIKKGETR